MATLTINQPGGAGNGNLSESRTDLVTGFDVTLVSADTGADHYWRVIDSIGAQITLSGSSGDSVSFVDPGVPYTVLIELVTTIFGVTTTTRRIASVRTPRGLRYAAFGETAPGTHELSSNIPNNSTDNENNTALAGWEVGQNWRGWAQWAFEVVQKIEASAKAPSVVTITASRNFTDDDDGKVFILDTATAEADIVMTVPTTLTVPGWSAVVIKPGDATYEGIVSGDGTMLIVGPAAPADDECVLDAAAVYAGVSLIRLSATETWAAGATS